MQVKKFEAPTIQEALDNVKRELGPEAIILQTKNNKRGFGLLSKGSVEITAAVSDRSLSKKKKVDGRLLESSKSTVNRLSAEKQADIYDKYTEKNVTRAAQTAERVEVSSKAKKITATRYIDIPDEKGSLPSQKKELPKSPKVPTESSPVVELSAEATRSTKSFEDEIQYLRSMIEDLKTGQGIAKSGYDSTLPQSMSDNPALQDAYEQLVLNGVERRYVLALIKKVAFELGPNRSNSSDLVMDLLAHEIMETVEVVSPLPQGHKNQSKPIVIAMVGPTGVGKTSTIAKLASEAMMNRKMKVGLINFDSSNLNAFEQLGTYARIINSPFRSATSIDDLNAALHDFKNLDYVMIDTTGRSHRDTRFLKEMHETLAMIPELRTYLVLAAATKDIELYDAASRYSVFRPQGIVISKLDEATIFGSIYNLSQRVKIPLASFTTGQSIPDDIEDASKERLASLLVDI